LYEPSHSQALERDSGFQRLAHRAKEPVAVKHEAEDGAIVYCLKHKIDPEKYRFK